METAEHREPYESRGSRTDLGAPGGESPPGDSTWTEDPGAAGHHGFTPTCGRSWPPLAPQPSATFGHCVIDVRAPSGRSQMTHLQEDRQSGPLGIIRAVQRTYPEPCR